MTMTIQLLKMESEEPIALETLNVEKLRKKHRTLKTRINEAWCKYISVVEILGILGLVSNHKSQR